MDLLDNKILEYLEKSSLPSFYKAILKNMLSSITRIKKEELIVLLLRDKDKQAEIVAKGEELCKRYGDFAKRLEDDPNRFFSEMEYALKSAKSSDAKNKSQNQISSIKQAIELQNLKKQVGDE